MPEFWASYRLHGPTEISTKHSLGRLNDDIIDITIQPGTKAVSGSLEFEFEADDDDHAEERVENDLRETANRIVSSLVFTLQDGLFLGRLYKVQRRDAPNKSQTDAVTQANEQILDVSNRVFRNINEKLRDDEYTRRALNWYALGQSTQTSEDRLVAFWTGLEASSENRSQESGLTEEQEDIIQNAKNDLQDTFGDEDSKIRDRVNGTLGSLLSGCKEEDNDEKVTRVLESELDQEFLNLDSDIDDAVQDIYYARNAIVHEGKELEDASSTAGKAGYLLRELLLARLDDGFKGFIDDQVPKRNKYSLKSNPEEWIPRVFEHDDTLELTAEEITVRAFALSRSFQKAYRFPIQNLAGEGELLTQVEDGVYKLNSSSCSS